MDSSTQPINLRPNVVVEPIVRHWYAWNYVLAPATAPFYVARYQLKLLESFIEAPEMHERALRDPAMMGGPFLNLAPAQAPAVKNLLAQTLRDEAQLFELAEAFVALRALLQTATGGALTALYPHVPSALRGYVELVYDLEHRPSFRVLEALLYKSRFAHTKSQSLALSATDGDERSFVFSTPRMPDRPHVFHIQTAFASGVVDAIARARTEPVVRGEFEEIVGAGSVGARELVGTLVMPAAPRRTAPNIESGVRIKYFGHASVLLESRHTSVFVDPLVPTKHADHLDDRFGFEDLPDKIDYVVITHNHQDHLLLETLLQLRNRVGTVVVPRNDPGNLADPSMKLLLEHVGFRNVIALDALEKVSIAGGAIVALPFLGEHADLNISSKAAFLVEMEQKRVLFAADSNNVEPRLYAEIRALFGRVDVLFVGMECDGAPMSWLYGPMTLSPLNRKADQSRRLDGSDAERTSSMVKELSPSAVYVYAMGAEPWVSFISSMHYTPMSRPITESDALVQACRDRGISADRLFKKREWHL